MERLSFKPFLLAFTAVTVALVTLAGVASAQAPGAPPPASAEAAAASPAPVEVPVAPPAPAAPVPTTGTLTLQASAFDCVPATDGSGAFVCNPKAATAAPHFEMTRPPVAQTATAPVQRNYFVEFLGGLTGELAAFLPALAVGASVGKAVGEASDCEECDAPGLIPAFSTMFLTYALVAPFTIAAGVTLFSKEDLSYSSALLGAAIGAVPGALITGLALAGGYQEPGGEVAGVGLLLSAASIVVAPILAVAMASPSAPTGAQAGNEEPRRRADLRARVLPTAGINADGSGATVGLIGRF
jgi:hypothetical protein